MKYIRTFLILFSLLSLSKVYANPFVEEYRRTNVAQRILELDPSNSKLNHALIMLYMELEHVTDVQLETDPFLLNSLFFLLVYPTLFTRWQEIIHADPFNKQDYLLYTGGMMMIFFEWRLIAYNISINKGEILDLHPELLPKWETFNHFFSSMLKDCYALYKNSYLVQLQYNLSDELQSFLKVLFPHCILFSDWEKAKQDAPITLPDFTLTPEELFPEVVDEEIDSAKNLSNKRKLLYADDNEKHKRYKKTEKI